jgi:hypothetical protein
LREINIVAKLFRIAFRRKPEEVSLVVFSEDEDDFSSSHTGVIG